MEDPAEAATAAKAGIDLVNAAAQSGAASNSATTRHALQELAKDPNRLDAARKTIGESMQKMKGLNEWVVDGVSKAAGGVKDSPLGQESLKKLKELPNVLTMPKDAGVEEVTRLGGEHLANNEVWREALGYIGLAIGLALTVVMVLGAEKSLRQTRHLCLQGASDRIQWRTDIDSRATIVNGVQLWLAGISAGPLPANLRVQVLQQQVQVETLRSELMQIQLELNNHTTAVAKRETKHSSGWWGGVGVIATTALSVALTPITAPLLIGSLVVVGGGAVVAWKNSSGGELAADERRACNSLDNRLHTVRLQADGAISDVVSKLNQQ